MLFSISSLIVLALGMLAIFLPHTRKASIQREISPKAHRVICISVFVLGCFARLFRLGDLPYGISAEEALVGVQAKALWETGGFLFDGGWTTQFAQWTGESAGPLLAVITAPFVGVLGMTAWTTRLPLALLSCLAMIAMYGVGELLGGKRAARWCLIAYAICPYFVLTARLTAAGNAAVCLLPLAVWMILRGMKNPAYLYAGVALMGLLSYAQNMYFFIAPTAIVLVCLFAILFGIKKRHAILAALMGILICFPAMLTAWLNLKGGESFEWLGIVKIPMLENFDKAVNVSYFQTPESMDKLVRRKFWAVICGSVFQVLNHLNISAELFEPTGLGVLYILSVPVMLLGALLLVRRVLQGVWWERKRTLLGLLMFLLACVTVLWLVVFGSSGYIESTSGYTNMYDYSAMLLFDVLLLVVGLCQMERRSLKGTAVLGLLYAASFVMLLGHLFGSGYRDNANTYFTGFGELACKANIAAQQQGMTVNVTGALYPHVAPADAAEMMYLYAVDADIEQMLANREEAYNIIYAQGIEDLDSTQIYLVEQRDTGMWDMEAFEYEEKGAFALLVPRME